MLFLYWLFLVVGHKTNNGCLTSASVVGHKTNNGCLPSASVVGHKTNNGGRTKCIKTFNLMSFTKFNDVCCVCLKSIHLAKYNG